MNGGIAFLLDSAIQIKYSHFHNNSAVERGGAICCVSISSVMIFNCSFIDNTTEQSGGAFNGEAYAMVTIMNTLFLSNGATFVHNNKNMSYEGGAISCKNACILTCLDCNFIENYAGMIEETELVYSKENVSIGGAVSVSDWSTLNMYNSKFISNKVSNYGGAIVAADFSTIIVSNSSFENNEAFAGAGIFVRVRSSAEISKSWFYNNTVKGYGAVATVTDTSQLNISETLMTSNHAPNSGGCFFLFYESTAMVSNCLFERNSVQFYLAGAIHVGNNSKLDVMNSTFIKNSAGPDGGSAIAAESSANIHVDSSSFSHNEKSSLCIKRGSIARIENSWIDNTKSDLGGAIVVAVNSTLYLLNVTFVDNEVEGLGGALFVQIKCKVEINYCTFFNNKASSHGGAIQSVHNNTIFINNTKFSNNTSKRGGAIISAKITNMTISHSVFVNNHASEYGGAVYIREESEVKMVACTFSGNTATVSGGAIQNFESNLVISENLFEKNSAFTSGGGAIYAANIAVLNMTNSVFSGNQALRTSSGGAIQAYNDASISLQNVTFQNNSAQYTGGVLAAGLKAIVEFKNCSFTNNQVNVYHGGAIFVEEYSLLMVHDSLFDNNRMQQLGCVYIGQSIAYFKNTIFKNNVVMGPEFSSAGGGIYIVMSQVRISGSSFSHNIAKQGQDLYVEKSSIYTYGVTFDSKNKILKSTDKDFQERTGKENIIYIKDEGSVIQETPYSSSKYVLIGRCIHVYVAIARVTSFSCINQPKS